MKERALRILLFALLPVSLLTGYAAAAQRPASGTGLSYQWWVKTPSSTKFTKSSITGPAYSVELTAARNGNQLCCVVTGKYGQTVQTNTVKMTVAP